MKKLIVFIVLLMAVVAGIASGSSWLKEDTAADFYFDVADADTGRLKTGLVIDATHVFLSVNGGAWSAKNESTDAVESGTVVGTYLIKLDTTDTATLGRISVTITDANTDAVIPIIDFMVVDANLWNPLFSTGQVDVWTVRAAMPETAATITTATFADANWTAVATNIDLKISDVNEVITRDIAGISVAATVDFNDMMQMLWTAPTSGTYAWEIHKIKSNTSSR